MKKRETYDLNPNLQYQYICFRKIHDTDTTEWIDGLSYYKDEFKEIHIAMERFFHRIHSLYLRHYVFKTLVQCDISDKYYNYIYKIHHELYLPSLRTPNHEKIRLNTVRQFFLRKEPREILYILRT